ncbi:MAG: CDP-diacylglycerol--serine O-phosphatidyltransferase [Holosporaceae bacterium]|jgi:CDP-diacylglycerol--serine O-phosphatidyltransferase|nr:CDP-diacylglycerol--serine O-phosphatidyltransferase [Holosporaceae bacterium]
MIGSKQEKKSYKEKAIIKEGDLTNKRGSALIKFLPSTITISAFCVGLTSIRLALFHRWELAIFCIFISAVLDALDGKVARLIGQSSQFGAQLDSLSDLVCFGVAPAIVLFQISNRLLGSIGWGICMFFTVCCALRLARFNAEMLQNEEKSEREKKYFKGVPAPAGAILAVFPMILFFQTDNYVFLNPLCVSCGLLISGGLMISCLRTFSSKIIEIDNGSAPVALLCISFLVIFLITDIWLTLAVLVTLYLFSIPLGIYRYAQTKECKVLNKSTCCSE